MATTPRKPARRRLSLVRRILVTGALLLGVAIVLAACANFIDRDDLTEVAGPVLQIERKSYWEDVVLYVRVAGAPGRFKSEAGRPGFAEFEAAVAEGTPVRLLVDSASLATGNPAAIYEAAVDGKPLIRFEETGRLHNRETWYVMLLGVVFGLLGVWIWHRATRPLPTPEERADYEKRLEAIAEKNPVLFLVVHVVNTTRQWGEKIPKLGDLVTVFLFFWILPLYMVFIYVTAESYRALVAVFCSSYWILLVALPVAAIAVPNFPGGGEYPLLGEMGSRIFSGYLVLNLAYGVAVWVWGTLVDEPEPPAAESVRE